jgi:hypothetical protein
MKDPKGPTRPYKTAEEIAKKHNVSLDYINKQVELGTEVEFEHTTSKKNAEITALQHLEELPDYYSRLKKMEKKKSSVKESLDNNRELLAGKRYCLLCNKHETESECSWGPNMWKKYSIASIHPTNESAIYEDHKEIASGKKKDEEGYMARIEFDQIERSINILRKLVKKGDQQLPAWVQSKITRAADFIDTAAEYMSSDEEVSEGKTYSQFMTEVAAWQRKEGKNPEGGLNEKGRKSYERENPGSDLKPPQPEGGPRKRSFCARMGGMPGPMKDEKGRPTRKALALRKWHCGKK